MAIQNGFANRFLSVLNEPENIAVVFVSVSIQVSKNKGLEELDKCLEMIERVDE